MNLTPAQRKTVSRLLIAVWAGRLHGGAALRPAPLGVQASSRRCLG